MDNSGFEENDTPSSQNRMVKLLPEVQFSNSTSDCYKTRVFGKWLFIKALKPSFQTDSRFIEAFRKEQEIGLHLEHPNLPKYAIAPDILPDRRTVVMEYIDGMTLTDFIKEDNEYFSQINNVEKFIREISSALDYLHSHQILHLDIKPDNILITKIGHNVKIIDFGFSKTDSFTESSGLTAGFAAPERLDSRKKAETADFYGLGKLLEYIRKRTKNYPVRNFKKIENGLLALDPINRIKSKIEIDRILQRKSKVPYFYILFAFFTVIVLTTGLFFILKEEKSDKIEFLQEESSKPEKEEGDHIVEVDDKSFVKAEKPSSKQEYNEPMPKSNDIPPDMTQFISLQASVDEAIRKQLDPVGQSINEALAAHDFSMSTYKRLHHEIMNNTRPLLKADRFKTQFPLIDEDAINDIIAIRMQVLEEDLWKKSWNEYLQRFNSFQAKDG